MIRKFVFCRENDPTQLGFLPEAPTRTGGMQCAITEGSIWRIGASPIPTGRL